MKKKHSIRNFLGITQQDLALLLGISRSQLSMFESGKRDLPLLAQQLLSEMLLYVQAAETNRPNTLPNQAAQEQLERLLRENEYQQLRLAREMTAATKKYEALQRAAKLAEFLESRAAGVNTKAIALLKIKRAPTIEKQAFAVIVTLEMHQESLILEKMILESRLRKLQRNGKDHENLRNG